MGKCYTFQKADDGKVDLHIFGDICEDAIFPGEVSSKDFAAELNEITATEIDVHIDSYGGEVSAGWAMYNLLKHHPAKIRTYGDGFVASAALYPFLAGDERIASNASTYYLHKVMTYAGGYADDLRKAADEADKLTNIGVNAFVEATGMDRETVLSMMENETWLSPDEALECGIVTSVVKDNMSQYAQSVKRQIMWKLRQSVIEPTPAETTPEIIPTPETPPEPTTKSKEELEKEAGNRLMNLLAGFSMQ